MRVLLADSWRVVNSKGGTEKVLCNMANELYERGYDVTILCDDKQHGKPFFFLNEKIKFMNAHKKDLHIGLTLANWFTWKREKRAKRRYDYDIKRRTRCYSEALNLVKPDLIICFTEKMCQIFIEYIKVDIPIILMFHFDADTVLNQNKYHQHFYKADCLQVLMDDDIDILNQRLPGLKNRIVRIGNVVPQYEEMALLDNKVIISVGRVTEKQKRHIYLVEAMQRLKDKYPDWKIEIWGETHLEKEYFQKLQNMITKYGLCDRVLFCGTTDNVKEKLKHASIFAFPSLYEGFALAMTEAMSMGLPIVGMKVCPAVNKIVRNGENGFLADESIESFTTCLDDLMSDRELRLKFGRQGKEDMKQYSACKIWDQWDALIKEVYTNHRK